MNILRCEHLTKTYGSGSTTVNALNGVDLAIKKAVLLLSSERPALENLPCFICWAVLTVPHRDTYLLRIQILPL